VPLGLAIGLRLASGRDLVVNAHKGADWNQKSAGELCSAIGDDIVW